MPAALHRRPGYVLRRTRGLSDGRSDSAGRTVDGSTDDAIDARLRPGSVPPRLLHTRRRGRGGRRGRSPLPQALAPPRARRHRRVAHAGRQLRRSCDRDGALRISRSLRSTRTRQPRGSALMERRTRHPDAPGSSPRCTRNSKGSIRTSRPPRSASATRAAALRPRAPGRRSARSCP